MGRRSAGRKGGNSEHDRGYKRLFSHPTAVEELLKGFLGEEWVEELYVPVPPSFRRLLPDLSYVLLDEARLKLDRPELAVNRVATLFRIETCQDPIEMTKLVEHLDDVLPEEEDPELRRTFTIWVSSVLRRTFPGVTIPSLVDLEEAPMLEENMREWARKARREARQEGRQEGEIEGIRKVLLQQMTQRFGRLPMRARRRVEEISSAQELRKLARRVLVAGSLEDMKL